LREVRAVDVPLGAEEPIMPSGRSGLARVQAELADERHDSDASSLIAASTCSSQNRMSISRYAVPG
jgi:hypothetical protein